MKTLGKNIKNNSILGLYIRYKMYAEKRVIKLNLEEQSR